MQTPPHAMPLSEQEIAQWQTDGYFVRRDVFSPAEVRALRDAVAAAASKADAWAQHGKTYLLDGKRFVDRYHCTMQYEHTPESTTLRVVEPINLLDERIDALIDDPRLAVPMQTLVGSPQLSLWTAKLNLKSAGGSGFGWHQDSPYWIHDCAHVDLLPNVMLSLEPQHPDNGCFRVIRGSHRHGVLPGTADGSQLGGFFTDPAQFDLADQIEFTVDAGALIFFHPHSIHGSAPNPSAQARTALIITYQPGDQPMLKTKRVRNIR